MTLNQRLLIAGGVLACLVGGFIWLASVVEFTFTHPEAPDIPFHVVNHRVVLDREELQRRSATGDAPELPRAVVSQKEIDFGNLPPLTNSAHVFHIRNDGEGPLKLSVGSSTCKCTIAQLPDKVVKPGQVGRIMLQWNTGKKAARYDHYASVKTNDPLMPQVVFRVSGAVAALATHFPEAIDFGRVKPGTQREQGVVIYSQTWDALEVFQVEPSSEGVSYRIEPASEAELTALEATSGVRLLLTSPPAQGHGSFNGSIKVFARQAASRDSATNALVAEAATAGQDGAPAPEAAEAPEAGAPSPTSGKRDFEVVEVPFSGTTLRDLCLYGKQINEQGQVDLRSTRRGTAKTVELLVRVWDAEKQLLPCQLELKPEFLQGEVVPHGNVAGMYRLRLTIPADAPVSAYNPDQPGQLRIVPANDQLEPLELPLYLLVLKQGG